MGDAAGEFAQGLHLLRIALHLLGAHLHGDVGHGDGEAPARQHGAAQFERPVAGTAAAEHDRPDKSGDRAVLGDFRRRFQELAVLPQRVGDVGIGGATLEQGRRQCQERHHALVPVDQEQIVVEHRDALAQTVEGQPQLLRRVADGGFRISAIAVGPAHQEPTERQHQRHDAGAERHQRHRRGMLIPRLGVTLMQQRILGRRHGIQRGANLRRQLPSVVGGRKRHRGCQSAVAARLDGLRQAFEAALHQGRQSSSRCCWSGLSAVSARSPLNSKGQWSRAAL